MTHDNVITYRPVGCDGFEEKDCSLLSFSDSDWACALVLSPAAAEYYEGSEVCRGVAFIVSIMEDFYKFNLDPTPLLIDNQTAICMSKLPQFTEKQKHIPIRICHLTECSDKNS